MKSSSWVLAITLAACGGNGDDDGAALDGGIDAIDAPVTVAQACAAPPGGKQRVLSPFLHDVEIEGGALWFVDEQAVWNWTMDAFPPSRIAPPPPVFASSLQVSGDEIFLDGGDVVWRWTFGDPAWVSVALPSDGLIVGELTGVPGGGLLFNTYCLSTPPCASGSPLFRLAPGAAAPELLSAGPVRPGWTLEGGAVFFQRSTSGDYETVRRDLSSGAERVLYVGEAWEDAHPPLAADGGVIYAAMGDSGPSWDLTPGAIEERALTDGALLRSWNFPRTPTKLLLDDTHVYWVDPGWFDSGPMPRPPEQGGIHRAARSDGTDELIAPAPGLGLKDMALTPSALYYTFEGDLWCLGI